MTEINAQGHWTKTHLDIAQRAGAAANEHTQAAEAMDDSSEKYYALTNAMGEHAQAKNLYGVAYNRAVREQETAEVISAIAEQERHHEREGDRLREAANASRQIATAEMIQRAIEEAQQ